MKWIAAFILICLYTGAAGQRTLSPEEIKIVSVVNRNMPGSLKLLEKLVNINSGTLHIQGVKQTGVLLQNQFGTIGFETTWIDLPDSLKRAGHLVAYRKGHHGKKVLLIGHLDTVFEPDMPANPFRILDDSTATGQGVNDMKGGDVVIFAALQALEQLGLLKNVTLTAYFTGDEENAGKPDGVSRADFISRAQQHDIALGFESAQGLHTVATARRGASTWQLKAHGIQAHSSGIFTDGYGSIYEAARILNAFREQLGSERYLTLNPGTVAGGSDVQYDSTRLEGHIAGKTNIISPLTIVQGDLRFLTEAQRDEARRRMYDVVTKNNLKGTHAEISFSDGIPAMEPDERNNRLLSQLNDVTLALGIGNTNAGDPGSRGAGDISYISKYVAALDGLGVNGKGAHAPGETIDLNSFSKMIERTAVLIYRLTR